MKTNSKVFFIIDVGHGGLKQSYSDPFANQYLTYPNKRVTKARNSGIKVFNEGVFNRAIGYSLSALLDFHGVRNCVLDSDKDMHLSMRSIKANNIHKKFPNAVLISIHYNYYELKSVGGFELFVYKNKGKSPIIADMMAKLFVTRFLVDERKLRLNDKDLLFKTKNLHMLRETTMPAILTEWGFMSNDLEFDAMSKLDGSQYSMNKYTEFLFESCIDIIDKKLY